MFTSITAVRTFPTMKLFSAIRLLTRTTDYADFKRIFYESLEKANLLQKHGDKTRVLDVSEEIPHPEEKSARIKKLGAEVAVRAGETCFVMQPFGPPHGDYYEKIFKPAIEKTGLQAVRADAEIFGTGKIIDQVWRGINASKMLVAELTTRNANVFDELGIAHALNKPVVPCKPRRGMSPSPDSLAIPLAKAHLSWGGSARNLVSARQWLKLTVNR